MSSAISSKAARGVRLKIDGVGKTYGYGTESAFEALRPTTVDIAPGEFVSVVGPSGCGKSTLMLMVAGVAEAQSATYWLQVDARAGTSQLMRYDGKDSDLPIIDNVSELRFEYFAGSGEPLDRTALTDGPWLPDGTFAHRFDADLLRVRRVRATVRVRANQLVLLTPIADRMIHLDISPRSWSGAP